MTASSACCGCAHRCARCRTLEVDSEPGKESRRSIAVERNTLLITVEAKKMKTLRVAVGTILDMLGLVGALDARTAVPFLSHWSWLSRAYTYICSCWCSEPCLNQGCRVRLWRTLAAQFQFQNTRRSMPRIFVKLPTCDLLNCGRGTCFGLQLPRSPMCALLSRLQPTHPTAIDWKGRAHIQWLVPACFSTFHHSTCRQPQHVSSTTARVATTSIVYSSQRRGPHVWLVAFILDSGCFADDRNNGPV
jgi:tRNA threonylcarbamoyladenosine modification (KEOPS) complex  Pcc1 subunit